jgi:hypothetical protein
MVYSVLVIYVTVIVKNDRECVRRVLEDATRDTFVLPTKVATRITLAISLSMFNLLLVHVLWI